MGLALGSTLSREFWDCGVGKRGGEGSRGEMGVWWRGWEVGMAREWLTRSGRWMSVWVGVGPKRSRKKGREGMDGREHEGGDSKDNGAGGRTKSKRRTVGATWDSTGRSSNQETTNAP